MERLLGGQTFEWNNHSYPFTPGKSEEAKLFAAAGGFSPDFTQVLNVRVSVLPEPGPQAKQSLKVNGYRYQIETLSSSPDGAWVKIVCRDPNRSA
jgi:hypothetical protein